MCVWGGVGWVVWGGWNTLKILLHCLFAYTIFYEKSSAISILVYLYSTCLFFSEILFDSHISVYCICPKESPTLPSFLLRVPGGNTVWILTSDIDGVISAATDS